MDLFVVVGRIKGFSIHGPGRDSSSSDPSEFFPSTFCCKEISPIIRNSGSCCLNLPPSEPTMRLCYLAGRAGNGALLFSLVALHTP